MITTSGHKTQPEAEPQRSFKLRALVYRCRAVMVDLLSGHRRRKTDADQSDTRAPQLTHPHTSECETPKPELVPLPDERSLALAVMCDRLLRELDNVEAKGAEIRFVVHKHDHPAGHPRQDSRSLADASTGELVWELRRLIAWSGGTIAEVAQVLEDRGADLDENARELLQDELAALDVDLATLNVHLADPVDWDTEFGCLLSGEVAPFDDLAADEDNDTDA